MLLYVRVYVKVGVRVIWYSGDLVLREAGRGGEWYHAIPFHQIRACSDEATPTKRYAASRGRSRVCFRVCLLRSRPRLVSLKIDSSQSER